jgi:putative ABC transport system ATP-binding protein
MNNAEMAPNPAGHIIQTVGLTMVYRSGRVEVPALLDVSLNVEPGEFVAIMGPSGCGKSTLLHLLGGLQQPTSGQILIDGTDLARLSDAERTAVRRRKVGYIFQRFNLLPTLSARGNIELAKKIHGNGQVHPYKSEEIIEMLGLGEKLNFRPAELSGGEQQRVAIARALINHPALILADEPTGSLDSKNSQQVLRILQSLNDKLNQTIVMITHDPDAASVASRIVEMRDGQVFSHGFHLAYEPELEGLF